MDPSEQNIATFAFDSRVFILLFQCCTNILIPDHDAGVFLPPKDKVQFSWADHLVHFLFGGLQRWDAVYFTHIIQFGYTYENCVAFFPLYPLVVSSISRLLGLLGIMHDSSWILLTSVTINVMLFICTSVLLYRLGKHVVGADIALYGAMIFCINPASIFMTAPYSEILYMFLLCLALLKLHADALITASFLIGLSVFTRSNGVVGIGFVLHAIIKSLLNELFKSLWNKNIKVLTFLQVSLFILLRSVAKTIICVFLSLAPFFVYQIYIYQQFCQPSSNNVMPADLITYGRSQGYHLLGDTPSLWCNDYVPLSYFYIQNHHWDVGFLRYYQIKQLPNFMLAFPILLLSVSTCRYYFHSNQNPFYTLGLVSSPGLTTSGSVHRKSEMISDIYDHSLTANSNITKDFKTSDRYEHNMVTINNKPESIVYVIHLAALTVFGCFFIHIQVLTRLLCSSSPLLYWFCGVLYLEKKQYVNAVCKENVGSRKVDVLKKRISEKAVYLGFLEKVRLGFIANILIKWPHLNLKFKALFLYFIAYCFVGTIMFSNFLPWT